MGFVVPAAQAQQLGVRQTNLLTITFDRVFSDSAFGKRIASEIEAESRILAAENRRIEAELTAEEQELTTRRPEMEPDEFRVLADAFDVKVQTNRISQDAKTRALTQKRDGARAEFLQEVTPVLGALMQETGASVILERSSVFFSSDATDITDLAIKRIDAAIGDGVPHPDPAD